MNHRLRAAEPDERWLHLDIGRGCIGFSIKTMMSRQSAAAISPSIIVRCGIWFCNASEAEMPNNDQDLLEVLGSRAFADIASEWSNKLVVSKRCRPEIADDLPVVDIAVRTSDGSCLRRSRIYPL